VQTLALKFGLKNAEY